MKSKNTFVNVISKLSLPILLVIMFAFFSVLLPNSFPTLFNIRSLINTKAPIVLLALAVLVPIAAGHFDLSVGYSVGLMHILAVGLQVKQGLPWPLACVLLILLGCLIGLCNGLLVTRAGIDSFIATLGTGQIIYGIAFWYTDGAQIVGTGKLAKSFTDLAGNVAGIPKLAIGTVVIALLIWLFLEYTPVGRYMYMLGSNVKASELAGVNPKKYLLVAFTFSGVLTAVAGIMLGAQLRVGQISVGPDYLMNSFAGALLGATCIRVGHPNVWGTVCAVMLMSVAVAGLQQLGASYFVEPLFNGLMLLIAVGLQQYSNRRRIEGNKKKLAAALAKEDAKEAQQ